MRFRFLLLTTSLFFLTSPLVAQWSTSTRAESTLYVCPGFYPGIVTFDDGSSIVLGALQSYIFARKLDERGYYLWTPPVQVFHNDSSFITDVETKWGGYVSDGDGGVILFWYDHRGAYRDQQTGRWLNNAIYAQRVDKFGMVRWNPGGVLVKGPGTGLKNGGITSDGNGGFVVAWSENGFGFPGAQGKNHIRIARYTSLASKQWEIATDSSSVQSDSHLLYEVTRGGERLYLSFYANGNFSRILDLNGNIITPVPGNLQFTIESERDSVVYATYYPDINRQIKIGPSGDTIWVANISLPDSCLERGWYFTPDGYGGAYMIIRCGDSLIHLDSLGTPIMQIFTGSNYSGRLAYADGSHGLITANATTAKRFNEFGQMVWPAPVLYMQNPGHGYFQILAADNKGGMITVFWHTLGGIYAHHTGRTGQVGIITFLEEVSQFPDRTSLLQNYPNPFNASTTITYELNQTDAVSLTVFDILGRNVKTLVDQTQQPGTYRILFDASHLASGVYFYVLRTTGQREQRRMLLLK